MLQPDPAGWGKYIHDDSSKGYKPKPERRAMEEQFCCANTLILLIKQQKINLDLIKMRPI